MKKVFKKAVGLFTALGLSMAAGVFPAMAQGDIFINVDALRKAKASDLSYVPLNELFIGFEGCTVTQMWDYMSKYNPTDVQVIGKDDDFFCGWEVGSGGYLSFAFTYVTYPAVEYDLPVNYDYAMWRAAQRKMGDQIWITPLSGVVGNQAYISYYEGSGGGFDQLMNQIEQVNNAYGIVSTGSSTAAAAMPQAQASWKSNANGWWYDNGDGTWPANTWMWIEGKCYYFDGNGYLLTNTTTPDNYQVNGNGEWVVNGMVQTQ